ncbi:MAG: RecQ family ATP-dependent DNA helicase, partial [Vicinamibacterales bacterium]|nr:RecQ family ATP-dependent DNA helicase [Vicinamibacterales bacterium]
MPNAPQKILEEVFGYDSFRGEQGEIIEHVTGGGDALVLMPTGGGKSLCYQIPAIARQRAGHGLTVVVSPLIALMHDQVAALRELGVEAAFLNSSLAAEEFAATRQRMLSGELTLLYAAPERVTNEGFLEDLTALNNAAQLAAFAIDEAHCVSQWGHDFRPEYTGLRILHERFPGVPRIALTATADALTRAEIATHLDLTDARVFISSFDRPNIHYAIV